MATNVIITSAIVDAYRSVYGYDVNRDIAMASQLMHDLHKPYVFQWQEDGSSRTEQPLAEPVNIILCPWRNCWCVRPRLN